MGGDSEEPENQETEEEESDSEENTENGNGETETEDTTESENEDSETEDTMESENEDSDLDSNLDSEDEGTKTEDSTETKPSAEETGEDEANTSDGAIENENEAESYTEMTQKTVVVHMEEYYAEPDYIAVNTLSDSDSEDTFEYADKEIEGITWVSTPEYDGKLEGSYVFTPVLPEEYILSEGVELPEIIVTVDVVKTLALSETTTPNGGVISDGTIWTEGTLLGGEVIINEGITLTITGKVTIEGEVIIKGGGTIKRGSEEAYFDVPSSADSITLCNVTVDGKSLSASNSMINVNSGGKVTLDDGCTIMNCNNPSGYGGAVRGNGNVILKGAVIMNCSAGAYGGAISLWEDFCTLEISSTKFISCSAGLSGGAIDTSYGLCTLEISDTEFANCSAGSYGGAIVMNSDTLEISGTEFTNCSAKSGGGAICMTIVTAEISDTEFTSCSTGAYGGAIWCDSYLTEIVNTLEISDTEFTNCSAKSGGAISMGSVNVDLWEVMIEDCKATHSGGAIYMIDVTAEISDTELTSCSAESYGGAISMMISNVDLWEVTIDDCKAAHSGGAIVASGGILNIYGGTYCNNKTTSAERAEDMLWGGGCIYTSSIELTIKGGSFIGNTAANSGGCIHLDSDGDTNTNLYDVHFENNICTYEKYLGSGAVFVSSLVPYEAKLYIAGNVNFVGDGNDSGKDGIYLDQRNDTPQKIWTSNAFSYPVTIYTEAIEYYVIVEGSGYTITNSDLKKINFVNIGKEAGPWYVVLNTGTNQVYLSKARPDYLDKYFVYYNSNGAEGMIKDDNSDNGYDEGDTITVKSSDGLSWEGCSFVEWNTQADGNGKSYQPGDELEITEDINLYAIFSEPVMKTMTATFYSGDPIQSETETVEIEEAAKSGTIEALELKDMDGWDKVGWSEAADQYRAKYKAGDSIKLKEDTSYYGIYQKNVTLYYNANEGRSMPASDTKPCYANVHDEITYEPAKFTVADGITRDRYKFVGWNTRPDGDGDTYQPNDTIETKEDITLYAIFSNDGNNDDNKGESGIGGGGDNGDNNEGGTDGGGNVSESDNNTANNNENDNSEPAYTPTVSIPTTTRTNNNNSLDTINPDTGIIDTSIVETVPVNSAQKDKEPKTGVSDYPQFYVSIAMIVGLSYIMIMLFERHGMTEDEKNAYISHIICWAKRGGRLRRLLAVAAIFMVLVYYHSVGKQNVTELKGAY